MADQNYQRKDHYSIKAKELGFRARSVFKLEEIDQKFRIFKRGDKVIDLGCFPGSWSQYASQRIGNSGLLKGVDLNHPQNLNLPNAQFIQSDINELDLILLGEDYFDVVLSDMAPNTTGIKNVDQSRSLDLCQCALQVSRKVLKRNGKLVIKNFEGPDTSNLVWQLRQEFGQVRLLRTKGSRQNSCELFIICCEKKNDPKNS